MIRKSNSYLVLIFCCNFLPAQIDAGFINHLTLNNLSNEHHSYLETLPRFSDSTNYFKTKFNLKYFNDTLLLYHYLKSKRLCDMDSGLLESASVGYLINSGQLKTNTWFNVTEQAPQSNNLSELRMIYSCSLNPNISLPENFPVLAKISYLKYKKAFNKKPFLAALMSTIVPGMGKLYAGKTRSFFTTIILNAAYATQTIESAKKLGPTHVFSIVNASAFTAFYLSNIFGSYMAVQQRKKEFKKQFLIDATRFYN